MCNETLAKKKLIGHFNKCRDAYFTCIDCSTTFEGDDFKNHTTCITEKEKYEKGYGKKQQKNKQPQPQPAREVNESFVNGGSKKENNKKVGKEELIPSGKTVEFSKVLKTLKKKHNQKRKEILKNIKVENCNGELVLKLADL